MVIDIITFQLIQCYNKAFMPWNYMIAFFFLSVSFPNSRMGMISNARVFVWLRKFTQIQMNVLRFGKVCLEHTLRRCT